MSDRAKRKKAPKRYVSRPTEIEAIRWTGENIEELWEAFGAEKVYDANTNLQGDRVSDARRLILLAGVDGVSGWLPIPVGHWIARNPGDNSDLWPLAPEVLDRKYKPTNTITVNMNGGCPQCGGSGIPGQVPSGDPPGAAAAAAAMFQAGRARGMRADG